MQVIYTSPIQPNWIEIRTKIEAAPETTIGGIAKAALKQTVDVLEKNWDEVLVLNRNSWPVVHLRPCEVPLWGLPHSVEIEGTNIVVLSKDKVFEDASKIKTIKSAVHLNKLITAHRASIRASTKQIMDTAIREIGLHHILHRRREVVSFFHSCEYLAKIKKSSGIIKKMAITLDYCPENNLSNLSPTLLNNHLMNIVKSMCEILDMLFQEKLIHRDIRPENLFIMESDGKLTMKLGNLNFAGTVEDEKRRLNHPEETIDDTSDYTSPEVLKDPSIEIQCSSKCNVWSMGITLYETIIGELPSFAAKNESQESINEVLNDFLIPDNCLEILKTDDHLRNLIFSMIRQMLVVDPNKRVSGSALLRQFITFEQRK